MLRELELPLLPQERNKDTQNRLVRIGARKNCAGEGDRNLPR
jgi:hypothetical protein